jgi:hypothetical protein
MPTGKIAARAPTGAQSVALINSAIAAAQTIDLNQAITVGELDIGASGGGGAFTLAANGGTLTFQNAPAPGSIQQLSTSKGDTISAPIDPRWKSECQQCLKQSADFVRRHLRNQ